MKCVIALHRDAAHSLKSIGRDEEIISNLPCYDNRRMVIYTMRDALGRVGLYIDCLAVESGISRR